eukprot:COSAG01_NODE_7081_length_3361_cov_3.221337_1_plen_260_part_00
MPKRGGRAGGARASVAERAVVAAGTSAPPSSPHRGGDSPPSPLTSAPTLAPAAVAAAAAAERVRRLADVGVELEPAREVPLSPRTAMSMGTAASAAATQGQGQGQQGQLRPRWELQPEPQQAAPTGGDVGHTAEDGAARNGWMGREGAGEEAATPDRRRGARSSRVRSEQVPTVVEAEAGAERTEASRTPIRARSDPSAVGKPPHERSTQGGTAVSLALATSSLADALRRNSSALLSLQEEVMEGLRVPRGWVVRLQFV